MWTTEHKFRDITAWVWEEPTLGTLERFQRGVSRGGLAWDEDPSIYGLNCLRLTVALGVASWDGVEINWPELDGDGALRARMDALGSIPARMIHRLAAEVQSRLTLSEEEAGN